QLAQLDWSRSSSLWADNIITVDPNPKNPAKPYKISFGASNIKFAVNTAKTHLGWI
ncbi:MAG: DNA sulfur modification protein DndB, partial [Cyanobacteriota bacterium]|nr:DNA sulfur modification protein DndB [Cyanobacteriota bacterium]